MSSVHSLKSFLIACLLLGVCQGLALKLRRDMDRPNRNGFFGPPIPSQQEDKEWLPLSLVETAYADLENCREPLFSPILCKQWMRGRTGIPKIKLHLTQGPEEGAVDLEEETVTVVVEDDGKIKVVSGNQNSDDVTAFEPSLEVSSPEEKLVRIAVDAEGKIRMLTDGEEAEGDEKVVSLVIDANGAIKKKTAGNEDQNAQPPPETQPSAPQPPGPQPPGPQPPGPQPPGPQPPGPQPPEPQPPGPQPPGPQPPGPQPPGPQPSGPQPPVYHPPAYQNELRLVVYNPVFGNPYGGANEPPPGSVRLVVERVSRYDPMKKRTVVYSTPWYGDVARGLGKATRDVLEKPYRIIDSFREGFQKGSY